MGNPDFENAFTTLVKGLPDLERIVSRIHAKNCKTKDFLRVLSVSNVINVLAITLRQSQSFKRLSKGFETLSEASSKFKSKTILGLLRTAPDLIPNVKNVEARFVKGEKGRYLVVEPLDAVIADSLI